MSNNPALSRRHLMIAGASVALLGNGQGDPTFERSIGRARRVADRPSSIGEGPGERDARFGTGLTPEGRAILPLHHSARRVWLDTIDGSDGASGETAAQALKTEEAAYRKWRAGDQLMIASGSVLALPCGDLRDRPGRSRMFPTVLQSYDRRAPQDETRFGLLANQVWYRGAERMFQARLKASATAFVAVRGIGFDHSADPGGGREYAFTGGIDWLLIEQCAFLASSLALNSARRTEGHVLRQSTFDGNWSRERHAQGVFTARNFDTVVEDCVFNHCGWRRGVARGASEQEGGPTIFNHGLYAQTDSGGVLRRSLFVEPSSHGAQLRGSWVSHDNVFLACPLPLLLGGGTNYGEKAPDGVDIASYRNLITVARDISPTLPRGSGIDVMNTRLGSVVQHCLIAGPHGGYAGAALGAVAEVGPKYEPNPTIIDFVGNTNAWSSRTYAEGAYGSRGWPERVNVGELDNITPKDAVSFVDPKRDGLTAVAALGFANFAAFDRAISSDPGRAWAAEITRHVRPGYAPKAASIGKVRNADGTIKGAVLPNGEWNDGQPWRG